MKWENVDSSLDLAKRMWSGEGQELTDQEFLSLYHSVRSSTDDIEALWQLGGAINDFLRRRPNAFPAPLDLAKQLLAADHLYARIVGLKLLTRCELPTEQFVMEVVRALRQDDEGEICGGLHELSVWLDRQFKSASKFSADQLIPLEEALEKVAGSNVADYLVEWATRQLAYVRELH